MTRQQEVRKLLKMSRKQMLDRAGKHLVIVEDIDSLHQHFAESIADEIKANNAEGRVTRLILPVGPVGQYPILADMVNAQGISLKRCWFFMMDEHCDDNGVALSADHPLSFRHAFHESFARRVRRRLMLPAAQLVFPDHRNVQRLKDVIESAGGVDTCYGGIGIHGHVAYNEPEPNIRDSEPRLVYLNDFTRTINAIRAEVGGNLECYPRKGVTLGMRQVLGARRIRLYCRNGIALDWANTVLRLALFGRPGDDYPVTYIRDHSDYVIVTDEDTARRPKWTI
jgi:glucosamine-6-phosphate deaminase